MKRRNLSSIYIFEKFEDEERGQPTCFEDCTEETQDRWLESLERESLIKLVKLLGQTLNLIGNKFDITAE